MILADMLSGSMTRLAVMIEVFLLREVDASAVYFDEEFYTVSGTWLAAEELGLHRHEDSVPPESIFLI